VTSLRDTPRLQYYDVQTLEYEIYAFDLSVRCAYLTNQRAFFNGSSVFLQPVGFENNICEVVVLMLAALF
jgi:predicted metalloprotease with PDZ domain